MEIFEKIKWGFSQEVEQEVLENKQKGIKFHFSKKWFLDAVNKKDFKDRPYLKMGLYTNYIKLMKIKKCVDSIESYLLSNNYNRNDTSILDLGCGKGIYSLTLGDIGYDVTGIDTNVKNLKIASDKAQKLKLKNVTFLNEDIDNHLSRPDRNYNVVLALDVLEHLNDPLSVIKRVSQKLTNPGLFIIIIPNGYDFAEGFLAFKRFITRKTKKEEDYELDYGPPHQQIFTLEKIKEYLKNAGLNYRFVSSNYTTWPPIGFLLFGGYRSNFTYFNTHISEILPGCMGGSWIIEGLKDGGV